MDKPILIKFYFRGYYEKLWGILFCFIDPASLCNIANKANLGHNLFQILNCAQSWRYLQEL
jgi:hypothetical protein